MGILLLMAPCLILANGIDIFLKRKFLSLIIAIIIFIIPFQGLMIAEYWRGFFGDLSITTIILLLNNLFFKKSLTHVDKLIFFIILPLSGIILYAGLLFPSSNISLYYSGYSALSLAIAITILGLLSYYFKAHLSALIALLLLASYYWHLLPSDNLWDYLLDPFLVLFGIYSTIMRCCHYERNETISRQ